MKLFTTIRNHFLNLLRYVLVLYSLNLFSQDLGTGLLFEPYELYSSIPIQQANPQVLKRGVPPKVDLRDQFPPAGFQGKQGSCVAFAASYAVQSYFELISRKKNSSDWNTLKIGGSINPKTVFSPAFVYNSLNQGKDNGITYFEALSFLTSVGSVPWEYMPYDPKDFTQKPNPKLNEIAGNYKVHEFRRVQYQNLDELKNFLASNIPVLTGIIAFSNLQELKPNEIYSKHAGKPLGGHAIVLVGYDDEKSAFLFLNSWGTSWGDGGYGWIDYNWYLKTAKVGYVILQDKNRISKRGDSSGNFPIYVNKLETPKDIFATQGNYSDKVVLTWEKVSGALGYEIYRSFSHEENFSKIGVSTTNTFVDDGVIPELAYSYKIIALSENEASGFSEQKVVGFASKNAKEIPAKVMGLKASKNYPDKIRLDWDELGYGANAYQVYKWDLKTRTFKPIAKVQSNWYEDKNPTKNGSIETYIVAALNKNIMGIPSNSVIGKVAIEKKLESPKDVHASQGTFSDQVVITWKKVTGAKEYQIYIYNQNKWELLGQTSKEEFIHQTKDRAKNFYVVRSIGIDGTEGEISEPVTGFIEPKLTRGIERLSPPKSLSAKAQKEIIYLDWQAVPNAQSYNIWLKRIGDPKWMFWGSVQGKDRTSFIVDLPEKDIVYLLAVTSTAENWIESEFSSSISAAHSLSKKSPQPRAFPTASKLEKLQGTWMGMYWESFTAKNMVMRIEASIENSSIKVSLNDKKIYEGKYIPNANEIELEGKLKIRLDSFRALIVEFKDKSISSENVEVAFLRE